MSITPTTSAPLGDVFDLLRAGPLAWKHDGDGYGVAVCWTGGATFGVYVVTPEGATETDVFTRYGVEGDRPAAVRAARDWLARVEGVEVEDVETDADVERVTAPSLLLATA